MEIYSHKLLVISITFLLLITGCGRKQKNFLIFPDEVPVKINKLDLPTVRGVVVQKVDPGLYISWLPLFSNKTPRHIKKFESNFVGYDVFRLANANIIPKRPLNEKPSTANYFIDAKIKHCCQDYYTIQPVFKFDKQILHGPSSQIVKILDSKP
jgi:hypothetical protein